MADDRAWLEELAKRTGASVEQSDLDRLGSTNPGDDMDRLKSAYESQYARRGASGQTGSGTDSAEMTQQGYGSGRNETADDAAARTTQPATGGSGGGGGGSVAQQWNNTGGGGGANGMIPQWYREMLEKNVASTQAAEAERKQKADALFGQLQGRATQSLAIDRNDPIIRAQADAFGANVERGRRNYVSDIAEKAGPLGNIRGEERMAAEHAGQATGGFEAELMGRELTSRRAEIADALNSMRGMLSADQQAQLQAELAQMDEGIKQAGVGLQSRGLDIQRELGLGGLDLQRELGMGGLAMQGRGLDQSMDQFLRELALREWDLGNQDSYRWAGI